MPSLIGSAPNQVPTNGMLGTMAFQDADNTLVQNLIISGVATAPTPTTGDNSTSIATTAFVGTASPAGQVGFFASNTAPVGWLKANGALVSRTAYANLFSRIGTTWGAGDGSTTFQLPDMRGEFPRGWDDGRGVDAGRSMGSHQLDASQKITGTLGGTLQYRGSAGTATGAFNNEAAGANGNDFSGGDPSRLIDFDSSRVVRAADETRPRNLALLACIKY